jgi:hypothetical protein
MSEPMWCEVRGHYCRCHDYGKRCDDFDEDETLPPEPKPSPSGDGGE